MARVDDIEEELERPRVVVRQPYVNSGIPCPYFLKASSFGEVGPHERREDRRGETEDALIYQELDGPVVSSDQADVARGGHRDRLHIGLGCGRVEINAVGHERVMYLVAR